ncbi:MAG TPA: acyl-ACP--UDP-N-acetylglucosamine O-acyltransferase [Ignavibacteriaceae bacterium]|nr:acyl-ACP--UDP-N-acetylglucosamine O-acyltransferase [Ignavibacteriaceae bacterium]
MSKIHKTAIIDPKANIDNDVEIGPYCVIEGKVNIAKGTKLYNNVTVLNGATIGENNEIYPGAVIGGKPQDLKFSGEFTEVFLGNNNVIRECCTLNRGTMATGKTIIGDNCLFMAYSHAAHDTVIGNNVILANSVGIGGHVHLGDYVILGGLTGVHQFVHIGKYTMIGAHSMVVKDVIPYALFDGDPLTYEGLNVIGLKRRGFSVELIDKIKKVYGIIYGGEFNTTQALAKIAELNYQVPEIDYAINFIKNSKRGISK